MQSINTIKKFKKLYLNFKILILIYFFFNTLYLDISKGKGKPVTADDYKPMSFTTGSTTTDVYNRPSGTSPVKVLPYRGKKNRGVVCI